MLGRFSARRPVKLRLPRLGQLRLISGQSGHEIPPSSLDEDSSKVGEFIDTRAKKLWPRENMALPGGDSIFDKLGSFNVRHAHRSNSKLNHLAETLAERPEKVWEEFKELYSQNQVILAQFGMARCTRLMSAVYAASKDRYVWGRVNRIATAVRQAGMKLNPHMHALLIRAAYRSRRFDKVFQVWTECEQSGFPRTTELWNSYISATCGCHHLDYGFNPKSSKYPAEDVLGPIYNDALDLLSQMVAEGLQANLRTYELLISSFAFKKDIEGIRTIASSVWGSPNDSDSVPITKYGSVTHPNVGTLTVIVRAFARCGEFQEGVAYADWLQERFSIDLSKKQVLKFWSTSLNWALWTASPEAFDSVWRAAISNFNVQPNRSMLTARLIHLEKNREYNLGRVGNITELLTLARKSENLGPYERDRLLKKFVHRIARNLAIRGYDARATKLVNDYSRHSPRVRKFRTRFYTYLEKSWRHNLRRKRLPRQVKTERANATLE